LADGLKRFYRATLCSVANMVYAVIVCPSVKIMQKRHALAQGL